MDRWQSVIAPVVEHLRHPRTCTVVHCKTGQIRSATVIASILVLAGGLTLAEAKDVLSAHRHYKGGVIPQLEYFDKYWWTERLEPGAMAAPVPSSSEEYAAAEAASAEAASPDDSHPPADPAPPRPPAARSPAASAAAASASAWQRVTQLSQQLEAAVGEAVASHVPADSHAIQARIG